MGLNFIARGFVVQKMLICFFQFFPKMENIVSIDVESYEVMIYSSTTWTLKPLPCKEDSVERMKEKWIHFLQVLCK